MGGHYDSGRKCGGYTFMNGRAPNFIAHARCKDFMNGRMKGRVGEPNLFTDRRRHESEQTNAAASPNHLKAKQTEATEEKSSAPWTLCCCITAYSCP
ncbi:hypothetical protein MHYP_G00215310 [Metynnis hypsauchen]